MNTSIKYRVIEFSVRGEHNESFLNRHLMDGWRLVSAYAIVDPAIEPKEYLSPHIKHFAVLEYREGGYDTNISLDMLRRLKVGDPVLYYRYLEDRLGPHWREIVADVAEMRVAQNQPRPSHQADEESGTP